jgi:predicted enzyme related to lactoylglutathione lyase
MLDKATVTANIPAADLERARGFYAEKLGLSPTQELGGMVLVYRTGSGSPFSIYQTEYAGQAGHTIAQWHVDDVAAVVRDLKSKGVAFEHYDMPGVAWDDDVAELGGMGKAAWFRDSENNILCIDDGFPDEPGSLGASS